MEELVDGRADVVDAVYSELEDTDDDNVADS